MVLGSWKLREIAPAHISSQAEVTLQVKYNKKLTNSSISVSSFWKNGFIKVFLNNNLNVFPQSIVRVITDLPVG